MILLIPRYLPMSVDSEPTEVNAVPIFDVTIVAVAPPESVMVTFLLLKSIALSFIMSSPSSTEALSEPFRTTLPSPVSSSNKKPSLASELDASVPSKIRVLPKSSFASREPASEPELSVPSNIINSEPTLSFSWNLSSNIFPPEFKLAIFCASSSGNDASSIKKLLTPPESLSSNCNLSVSIIAS